jgi:Protein of unknown function (DUF3040)
MALSMDEQRALAEIERRLAADDPGLATCLTAFRRPGPAHVLRSPRARIVGSLFTVLLVAMVSLMVYAMIPFRTHGARPPGMTSTGTQSRPVTITTSGTGSAGNGNQSASTKANAAASATPPAKAATPSAGHSAGSSPTQPNTAQAAGNVTSRAASPPVP